MTASITHESGRGLQLEIGAKVFVLIKASAVEITPAATASRLGTNQFGGVVDVLIRGELRSEAQILVDQHLRLVVTLDNSLLDELKLEQLMRVHCRVDPSSVILAVAA